jgi:hypothetical protein
LSALKTVIRTHFGSYQRYQSRLYESGDGNDSGPNSPLFYLKVPEAALLRKDLVDIINVVVEEGVPGE